MHLPENLAPLFLLNDRGFLGRCFFVHPAFFMDVAHVKANCVRILLKQERHLFCVKPSRLALLLTEPGVMRVCQSLAIGAGLVACLVIVPAKLTFFSICTTGAV